MKRFLIFTLIAGSVFCDNEIPEDLQNLAEKVHEIPGLENFNQSNVPALEEAEDLLKKKCEKNGGEAAFDKVTNAQEQLQTCVTNNFNFTQIQQEVDKAKETGSMDEVFSKYCAKKEVIYNCVKNLTDSLENCLETEEKESMKLILNVTDSLANFVCFKDGDRIAMFVAEGGIECLESQKDALQKCANDTLSHRIPQDLNVNNLPLLLITSQECNDFAKLQKCVVDQLEHCADNTPANIVDALFKFIRRVTPCKNHPVSAEVVGDQRLTTSGSSTLSVSIFMVIATAILRYI